MKAGRLKVVGTDITIPLLFFCSYMMFLGGKSNMAFMWPTKGMVICQHHHQFKRNFPFMFSGKQSPGLIDIDLPILCRRAPLSFSVFLLEVNPPRSKFWTRADSRKLDRPMLQSLIQIFSKTLRMKN